MRIYLGLCILVSGIIFSPIAIGAFQSCTTKTPHASPDEFAPGYPNYSVSQLAQLREFPLPRYKSGSKLRRNFPWYDFLYTAYNYDSVKTGPKGLVYPGWGTAAHGDSAIALEQEMYEHWNYYFNIPTPTYNSGKFFNKHTFAGAIAAYADAHPEMQTCTYLFWGGINPKSAGFTSTKPYIKSNANIDPCTGDKTYPNIAKDGIAQRKLLAKLFKSLPHRDSLNKIDFINENGEVFGQAWTPNAEGYRGNPLIACVQPDSGNARVQRAQWQYDVFAAYRNQFLGTDSLPGAKNSFFSFYQVSAFLPDYYSEYSVMRKINSPYNGSFYSTPDFYPGDVTHDIFDRYAAYHGLDCIADGRETEMRLGDNYFSPFVCGGWFDDSLNYRPAPWLAAMKALGMMGAEFYYSAFFNTVNPAKKMPIDPRGYIYQVAMPSYAQAVTSRYEDIFSGSKSFSYKKDGDYLCIYRKLGNRYVIFAGYFPKESDVVENRPRKVDIDGEKLMINFRRQGSVYIYDKTDANNIVFYQLDGWQEATHPYYWSKDFLFEAELHDDAERSDGHTEKVDVHTIPAAANDYSAFTSWISLSPKNDPNYRPETRYYFEPRAHEDSTYYIWIRARIADKSPNTTQSLVVRIDNLQSPVVKDIGKGDFQWYCAGIKKDHPHAITISGGKQHFLQFELPDEFLEVDKILLSKSAEKPVK